MSLGYRDDPSDADRKTHHLPQALCYFILRACFHHYVSLACPFSLFILFWEGMLMKEKLNAFPAQSRVAACGPAAKAKATAKANAKGHAKGKSASKP